ncbi:hypothetical protein VD0003_g4343 [Verticillium dahliae]|nr:hypothetical protein VD0003_g4343 [Verticillium dahliae]
MDLTSRIALTGPPAESPEDFLSSALATLDPDDQPHIHGDSDHGLLYTSPHLPKPFPLSLADPATEQDRRLFSHYLWNSSLLLAELIEAGSLPSPLPHPTSGPSPLGPPSSAFNVKGLATLELGAGTALPSLLAALLSARRVVVTDYPAASVLETLRANVTLGAVPAASPTSIVAPEVTVEGHAWGDLTTPLAVSSAHAFDRLLMADCLWMPWLHDALLASISHFLADTPDARVWIVAGFHSGREKMRRFFDADFLAAATLEVESIWERDAAGVERAWVDERPGEEAAGRKRWLVVAILRRTRFGVPGSRAES